MTNVFEEKSVSKAVIKLGIPGMLGSLAGIIYNIADTYFVAMAKVPAMIAAVTLCSPVFLMIMSVALVFGMGGGSVIARQIGAGREQDAAKCFNMSFYAMFISGIVVGIIGVLITDKMAMLVGADAENFEYTCDYLKYVFMGAPVVMLGNGLVHSFRSIGLAKEATIGITLGNAINIVLDWVLIVVFKMGTAGAAIATVLGVFFQTVYYVVILISQEKKNNPCVKIEPKYLSFKKEMVGSVVKIGIPGALITIMLSVSFIVQNNFIANYGSDAVASYGIANRVDMFPVMLLVGFSQGVTPLIGYCYGQKNEKRLSETVRLSILYSFVFGAFCTVIIFFENEVFAHFFLDDKELIKQAGWFLKLMCFHSGLTGIINIVTAYFQALGKALHSLIITILRNVVVFIPGLIIMNLLFKLNGIILSVTVVELVISAVCLVMYAANNPKKIKYIDA